MSNSETLFERALKVIPGGVNSPVRAFNGVGGTPVFIDRAEGACLIDADGKSYIDYVGSWGPMICGHANPEIIDAVCAVAKKGLSFGAPTALEIELAENICSIMPNMDQVRMTLFRIVGPTQDMPDLIQNALIEVMRSLRHYRGDALLRTWIDRVCANVAYQHLRKPLITGIPGTLWKTVCNKQSGTSCYQEHTECYQERRNFELCHEQSVDQANEHGD